jgi:hypothetical protein
MRSYRGERPLFQALWLRAVAMRPSILLLSTALLVACQGSPEPPPEPLRRCVVTPNNLVECSAIEDAGTARASK